MLAMITVLVLVLENSVKNKNFFKWRNKQMNRKKSLCCLYLRFFELGSRLHLVTCLLTKATLASTQLASTAVASQALCHLGPQSFKLASWPCFASHLTPIPGTSWLLLCGLLDFQIWSPLKNACATSKCRRINTLWSAAHLFYKRKHRKDKTETKIVIYMGSSWEKHSKTYKNRSNNSMDIILYIDFRAI